MEEVTHVNRILWRGMPPARQTSLRGGRDGVEGRGEVEVCRGGGVGVLAAGLPG